MTGQVPAGAGPVFFKRQLRDTMGRRTNNSYKLAFSGIFLALAVVSLYIASVIPGLELTFYALSSVFIGLVILETGIGGGILVYAAAALLGFLLIPNKAAVIPFIFFFGIYAVIKAVAEKPQGKVIQMVIKIAFFAAVFSIAYLLFKELFFGNIDMPDWSFPVLLIAGIAVFVLYDFIFTLILEVYKKRVNWKAGRPKGGKSRVADEIKLSHDDEPSE